MMHPRSSVLRDALAVLSVRWIAMQAGLALLVAALSVVWLRLPDASAADLIATVLLGLLILLTAASGEVALLLKLCRRPMARRRLITGGLLMLGAVALWFAWSALIDHLSTNDMIWAGYLNSRFSASMRRVFSYSHIELWLGWIWSTLTWIGAGILAVLVCAFTASERPAAAIKLALRSGTYWVVLVLASVAAPVLTNFLMGWTPGHGARVELLSLVLRLSALVVADGTLVALVLAVLAACVRRSDAAYETPVGNLDESQPRTTDMP